ncbi:hypothetical protein RJ639_043859 [Escallonia herrerae]|uniref:protein-serine/threonine phosphatase n=1 Tax=Escallonia herrerae TaxID=1293975 RepID=A0AA89B2M2_9ASTE|nr:hypothetical protein RJ639_043859 [Escallonia herrerae]
MVAEAEILCEQRVSVQFLCGPSSDAVPVAAGKDFFGVPTPPAFPGICGSESVSVQFACSESVLSRSTNIQTTSIQSPTSKFVPRICSGSHTDIGPRSANEDEHIRVDDLSTHLGPLYRWPLPSSFYAVFDGHGGADASAYVKNNAMRLFFEGGDLPQSSDIDDGFMEELQNFHHKAFLLADQALADECSVGDSCGTTALTALVLGRHLLVANAGDCRAVLCKKGVAVPLTEDHRPTYLPEKKRVEELGGYIEYGYLNGELAVTRALGDWSMKYPCGSASPLTAEPDVRQVMLTEDDEFMILGCDGLWDVMSNQEAVNLVRRELRRHNDPQRCARELVKQALRLDTGDNLTAIVVCFSSPDCRDFVTPQRPRFRCCSLSEEARNKLRGLLEGN